MYVHAINLEFWSLVIYFTKLQDFNVNRIDII